jgi:MATE family multidrug resistance protein
MSRARGFVEKNGHDEQHNGKNGVVAIGTATGTDHDDDVVGVPRTKTHCWRQEVLVQLRTAFPSVMSLLLYKIPWMVSLRFVGRLGALELAAAALATTLCNVTGMSLSVGLSSALTTLASQARGDFALRRARKDRAHAVRFVDDHKIGLNGTSAASEETTLLSHRRQEPSGSTTPLMPLVYLYRGLVIQLLFLLPMGVWWLRGVRPALVALGQGETLSSFTESYLRVLAPGLWSYSINWTVTSWLQAIELAHVPAYAAVLGLAMHVPCNYLFIYGLGWGYLGCAAATVMFQLIQPAMTVMYLFGTRRGRRRVLNAIAADAVGRSELSFWLEMREAVMDIRGCLSYLGLAVPGIVIISEWWASEVSIFLAGRLVPSPDLALGALTLNQTLNTFCFMFPTAFGIAGSARVGSLLGGGDAAGARFSSQVSVVCAGAASGLLGFVVYWTPHAFFPSLFAPDEADLIRETSRTMTLLAVYVFADGVQAAFNGTVKGCGRQPVIMPVVVFAYWVVGVPVAYYISFVKFRGLMCSTSYFCGQVGLVAGMTLGT